MQVSQLSLVTQSLEADTSGIPTSEQGVASRCPLAVLLLCPQHLAVAAHNTWLWLPTTTQTEPDGMTADACSTRVPEIELARDGDRAVADAAMLCFASAKAIFDSLVLCLYRSSRPRSRRARSDVSISSALEHSQFIVFHLSLRGFRAWPALTCP